MSNTYYISTLTLPVIAANSCSSKFHKKQKNRALMPYDTNKKKTALNGCE